MFIIPSSRLITDNQPISSPWGGGGRVQGEVVPKVIIGFSTVLVGVWFLHSSLIYFSEEATFSSLSIRPSTKALQKVKNDHRS